MEGRHLCAAADCRAVHTANVPTKVELSVSTKYEFQRIAPDGFLWKELASGKKARVPLYSRKTQYREHGQSLLKNILQSSTEDLPEGPTKRDVNE